MDKKTHGTGPAWGRMFLGALLIAALWAVWRYTPLSELITPDRVTGWARTARGVSWGPIILILAYTPAMFTMFPRPLLTLFSVIAFGPWLGFAYSMIGILGAALVSYYAGRALPRKTVERLAGEKLDPIGRILRRHGLLAALAVRIVPVGPFAVEGIVAGALHIKLWQFAAGTLLGMLPGTLTTTVFGHQIATALEDPSKINYWIVGGIIVLFVVLTAFVHRWFSKQGF